MQAALFVFSSDFCLVFGLRTVPSVSFTTNQNKKTASFCLFRYFFLSFSCRLRWHSIPASFCVQSQLSQYQMQAALFVFSSDFCLVFGLRTVPSVSFTTNQNKKTASFCLFRYFFLSFSCRLRWHSIPASFCVQSQLSQYQMQAALFVFSSVFCLVFGLATESEVYK